MLVTGGQGGFEEMSKECSACSEKGRRSSERENERGRSSKSGTKPGLLRDEFLEGTIQCFDTRHCSDTIQGNSKSLLYSIL